MIQVINRALDILEFISNNPQKEHSLGEISAYTGLNNGTCANIIKTLVSRNYLEHLGPKKGYRMGIMPLIITDNEAYIHLLANACRPPMNSLCAEINEAVLLSVIRSNRRILVYEAQSNHEIQVRTTPEQSVYKATTARMIISSYSEARLDRMIAEVGLPTEAEWPEVHSVEELKAELAEIRQKGFVMARNASDVVSMAVPVEIHGHMVASVGIYLPGSRFSDDLREPYAAKLRDCARIINEIGLKKNLFVEEH